MNKQKQKYENQRIEIAKRYKERILELERENSFLLAKINDLKYENKKLEDKVFYLEERYKNAPESLKALLELTTCFK